jgi:alpha-beta hydrolase superfamily lysophospholipase
MRESQERVFHSFDDTQMFYRMWDAPGRKDRAIVLFHRGHEHSGRWQDVVDQLDLPEIPIFAWDARGHGLSPGQRGDAPDFSTMVRDADSFVRHVSQAHGIAMEDIAVIGHSVGSVIAATWVHDFAPPIRALVLGSPALRIRLYVPFAIPLLRLLDRVRPGAFIRSYVKGRLLTRDPDKQREYDTDRLITPAISVKILLGLHDAATRLIRDAAAITAPTLMLVSGADWVVKRPAQKALFRGLGSTNKAMHILPGFRHDTFNERDNDVPIGMARRFIVASFAGPAESPCLLTADRDGASQVEYQDLTRRLSPLSPAGAGYALMRLLLRSVGRLSDGIRLGWRVGFDSGAMMDYVYRNRAAGLTPLGRLIDRLYLNSVGWRGIRTRKQNLEAMLDRAMDAVRADGMPVRLVDIATGHGRYVLDALDRRRDIDASAMLRDIGRDNVAAGRELARSLDLRRVTFERGDAFDGEALSQLSPRPTVAVAAGLYELFPGNDRVRVSLMGLGKAVEEGGYLIYTNQPWHPQLAFIARVLTSHRGGRPWVMRRRSQAEMDQLVAAAGFEKIAMAIDPDGIFTVSLARRRMSPALSGWAGHPAAAE